MTLHPYIYCKTCFAVQPVFYDFGDKEWVCFVCGHAVEKPEDGLREPDKLQVKKAL